MSYLDNNAFEATPQRVLDQFAAANTAAPAALMEVWRAGLSVAKAHGETELGSGQPASADDRFEVGSQSKMMTAVLVLQLVQEGKVALDDKLSDHLDLSGLPDIANLETATIRHLLANRSGIPDFDTVMGDSGLPVFIENIIANPDVPQGPDEMLDIAAGHPAAFAPGQGYEYSNTNFLLLEKLIEKVTGNSMGHELTTRIFDPLGMDDTLPGALERPADILHSYATLPDGTPLEVTNVPINLGGAGGVVSTTADMIRFLDALLVSKTLLSPEMLAQMTDYRDGDNQPSGNGNGLGLGATELNGQHFVGFFGGTLGTNSGTILHVESGTIVSVAVTHSGVEPSTLVLTAFELIFSDGHWASFDPTDDSFTIEGSAAEVDLYQDTSATGAVETVLTKGDVSLSFAGDMAGFDEAQLSFSDGSVLRVADAGGEWIDILHDTRLGDGGETVQAGPQDADNRLIGLGGNDGLFGAYGDDRISGGGGNDRLGGRDGDDALEGGDGHDVLDGGRGDDQLSGGAGSDQLNGGRGDDTLEGGAGHDLLDGGRGDDQLSGGAGSDQLSGGRGDDTLEGGAGHDLLDGGRGDDQLSGGAGSDQLSGGRGDDTLEGGAGHDLLKGGRGDDRLEGGAGHDMLIGGSGDDVFVFAATAGHDHVLDFQAGADRLDLSGAGVSFAELTITAPTDGFAHVAFGQTEITLTGQFSELTEADFLF
ncbi:serine hydrolase [Ruegeria pomeroyi]|nr:serine hydrolase [Ruegeria pomeroyi]NVK95811.1 serine hydrolase [Ruegeria pomeroyi]NVL00210.1 serine hydrolase [Ruegeria pomeroyi]QWV08264.1 serine hydrolase [Ruegeria pomeroyi]